MTQETFLRASHHFETFDPTRSFEAWVFRIARNLMIDQIRRRKNKRPLSLDMTVPQPKGWTGDDGTTLEIADSTGDPVCCLMKEVISTEIEAALHVLPPMFRTTLLLLAERHSHQKIARICDCSIGTVRSCVDAPQFAGGNAS